MKKLWRRFDRYMTQMANNDPIKFLTIMWLVTGLTCIGSFVLIFKFIFKP